MVRFDIGSCRNARLNKARRSTMALGAMLKNVEGIRKVEPLLEAEFWEAARDLANEISQCVHEANAYNNSMVPQGIEFDRETYVVSEPRGPAVKTSDFESENPGSNPGGAATS